MKTQTVLEQRLGRALVFSNMVANNPTEDNVKALRELRGNLQREYDSSLSPNEDESMDLTTLNVITDRIENAS